ncbi:norbelladine synthase [Ziziphus jujuba]|uniref:Norbelladine synthase n=1 Tax=Ziziphus jujuba TaxID=326968 RepID=A0A6P3ZY71_ZIZJJ|nr:norbelladine synthase [Ziziphus jujuba]
MVSGQVSHELEVKVPAGQVWELYGSLRLAYLVQQQLSNLIEKVDVIHGDGGVGTVLQLTFVPGFPSGRVCKEKFTKVDDEKRVKESEVIEGGFLDLGFTLYRVRFEIIEKEDDKESSSIIKSTIEYDVKEEAAANASFVSIKHFADIAETAKNSFTTTTTT